MAFRPLRWLGFLAFSIIAMLAGTFLWWGAVSDDSTQRPETALAVTVDANGPISATTKLPTENQVGSRLQTSPLKGVAQINVWDATDSRVALNVILRSELPEHHEYLTTLRAVCQKAVRIQKNGASPSSTGAENLAAHEQYAMRFCADPQAVSDVELAIKEFDLEKIGRLGLQIEPLLEAAYESKTAALAFVDEIFHTESPVIAANLARLLSHVAAPDGSVPEWGELLPERVDAQQRAEAFALAGEMLACQRMLTACASNMPLVMFFCNVHCRPGEGLIDFRRRTTVPFLFESAQRIAVELERHRSR